MAFTFGAPAPASGTSASTPAFGAATTPAPATGFSFGGTAATSTVTPAPAPGGFSFGGATPTPTPAPASGGFSFGGATGGSTTTTTTAGGFSFAGTTPVPGTATATAPATGTTSTGFSFGGGTTSNPTPAPAPGGSFFTPATTATATASNLTQQQQQQQQQQQLVAVPEFEKVFPYLAKTDRIQKLLIGDRSGNELATQELEELLNPNSQDDIRKLMADPPSFQAKQPDTGLRTRLQQSGLILLRGKEAKFTTNISTNVFQLADELKVSELEAIALYAGVSDIKTREWLEREMAEPMTDDLLVAARNLFFWQHGRVLSTMLQLIQRRIEVMDGGGNTYLRATDQLLQQGLVKNLIKLVIEYTKSIGEINHYQIQQHALQQQQGAPPSTTTPKIPESALLAFFCEQRQTASECLFFLAYHTQLLEEEVVALLDLIRDLSVTLPLLHPVADSPNPYQGPGQPHAQWHSFVPKERTEWEMELVNQQWEAGNPQLLRCVSVLTLSAICALDTKHKLLDRDVNTFRHGNALWPPQQRTESSAHLKHLHSRLDPTSSARESWKRPDIWGVLSASYGLLLQPTATMTATYTSHTADSSSTIFRSCLEVPTANKSLSFLRWTLLPTIASEPRNDEAKNAEFYLSVLSEFASTYVDSLTTYGELPISRAKWFDDAEKELRLEQQQQRQQRQFEANYGGRIGTNVGTANKVLPTEVDVSKRPDCIDDIIALAVAICMTFPTSAGYFLNRKTLRAMERVCEEDDSLLSIYVTFLASLCLAEEGPADGTEQEQSGATVVSEFIPVGDSTEIKRLSWKSLLSTIQYYVKELSPQEYSRESRSSSSSSESRERKGREYYYGIERTSGSYSRQAQQESSMTSSSMSKSKELGETNTWILLSHLHLLANMAAKSPNMRDTILALNISSSVWAITGNDALAILFSLVSCPVSPQIRGATFYAIASLIRCDISERLQKEELVLRAWDMLEATQILPIALLDQFFPSTLIESTGPTSLGLQFGPNTDPSRFPASAQYGIVYDMEYRESKQEVYPATEGFLFLLSSLISSGGCPSDIGKQWRIRTGCAPYIEYVIRFVLPRAMGPCGPVKALKFRSPSDKNRLLCRALEVVETTIAQYVVPPQSCHFTTTITQEEKKEGLDDSTTRTVPEFVKDIMLHQREFIKNAAASASFATILDKIYKPAITSDLREIYRDYKNELVSLVDKQPLESLSVERSSHSFPKSRRESVQVEQRFNIAFHPKNNIPRAKSPGFTVLVAVLSSGDSRGNLFHFLSELLIEGKRNRGSAKNDGLEEMRRIVAMALFGETLPSFTVSKERWSNRAHLSSSEVGRLSQPVFPTASRPVYNTLERLQPLDFHSCGLDYAHWRERKIVLALRILCAAASREESFRRMLQVAGVPIYIAPVTRLTKGSPMEPEADNVNVSHLSQLLAAAPTITNRSFLFIAAQYIGHRAIGLRDEEDMARAALALLGYVMQSLPVSELVRTLSGTEGIAFSEALASRLKVAAEDEDSNADVAAVILDWILLGLRKDGSNESMSLLLLGLSSEAGPKTWVVGNQSMSNHFGGSLDVIWRLLLNANFVMDDKTCYIAVMCYEVLYRLCTMNSSGVSSVVRSLREDEFWSTQLLRVVDMIPTYQGTAHNSVLHCIAWLLKGISNELYILSGGSSRDSAPRSVQSTKCRSLLSVLFAGPNSLFVKVLDIFLMAQANNEDIEGPSPSRDRTRWSVIPLSGMPDEVSSGFFAVDVDRLIFGVDVPVVSSGMNQDLTPEQKAAQQWGVAWNGVVSRACAISHVAKAWSKVISVAFTFCNSMPLELGSADNAILSDACAMQLLNLILGRMSGEAAPVSGSQSEQATRVPLCVAVFHLSNVLLQSKNKTAEVLRGAAEIASSIAGCIASFAGQQLPGSTREVAYLSCSLTMLLRTGAPMEEVLRSRTTYLRAAEHLCGIATSMAVVDADTQGPNATPEQTSSAAVVHVARSCLIAIFDAFDHCESGFSFVYELLSPSSGHRKSQDTANLLLKLLEKQDAGVSFIMQRIACDPYGETLLLDKCIFRAIGVAAENYFQQEEQVISQLGMSANREIKIPAFIKGHLSLMATFLSSTKLPADKQSQLASDACIVLSLYSRIGDRLLQTYPRYSEISIELVQCLDLATSAMARAPARVPINVASLQQKLITLAFHIAEYPLPASYLPVFPGRLVLLEKNRNQQHGSVSIEEGVNRTWWDTHSSFSYDSEERSLPGPPSGAMIGFDPKSSKWSPRDYESSIIAVRFLEKTLQFLIKIRSSSPDVVMMLDPLAIAKGIFRCALTARAINAGAEVGFAGSADAQATYLQVLGPLLGRCTEAMLMLAASQLDVLQKRGRVSSSSLANDTMRQAQLFGASMLPVLESTTLDMLFTMGRNSEGATLTQSLSQKIRAQNCEL